ncbi:MAG: hypothetical protein ABR64_05030 [Actinobacteria bacterium BACL2 MAG-121001-bin67]|uniref:Peptidase S8/S53 domain-containing protein n=1 Tax=Actinobacteria bacterium BACL2 MAG-121001-bin67 TaxID=1655572 RepID=A0A0R2PA81_9ACTN|nr:MAG: hypothetical protein ABR64_05030 [Actinobacteria bacterium BACL2 MAG-121001-bin67]KRO73371.1 MAG: hypothetical protein ABS00_04585 [Actinobacteria bacterium BACL2 MAG-120920-bin34]
MIKRIILLGLFSTLLITASINPVVASDLAPSVAILDSSVDGNIVEIKKNLLHEVCILEWSVCPNGRYFLEGPGSAFLPVKYGLSGTFDHGTQMASIAISTNPSIPIVFMRIIGAAESGARLRTSEQTVYQALEWVLDNQLRFNIQAVALAQGSHNLSTSKDYCPRSARTATAITNLFNLGIPVFVASGNNGDKSRVSWPGCLPLAIPVGAVTNGKISNYSNIDPNLSTFLAVGEAKARSSLQAQVNASGTSVSTQVFAAMWIYLKTQLPELSFAESIKFLKEIGRPVTYQEKVGYWIDKDDLTQAVENRKYGISISSKTYIVRITRKFI